MDQLPKNYSKSANRALDVMEYFAEVGVPLRATDIADALGLARSSADQLLKSMTLRGHLTMTDGKRYFPSLRMARFGQWIAGHYSRFDLWCAIKDEIHRQTDEVVTITVQNDCFMQIMSSARSRDDDPTVEIGERIPVAGSAIGGAALSSKSVKQVGRIYRRARAQNALMDGAAWDQPLVDEIPLFRMKGYAWRGTRWGQGENKRDYWSIAMPLPHDDPEATVILGLGGPYRRVKPQEWDLVNLMRRTIRTLSAN